MGIMQELAKRLDILEAEFLKVYEKLKIAEKLQKLVELEKEVAEPDIWKNVEEATAKNQELAKLQSETESYELLKTQISDLKELMALSDEEMKAEFAEQITAMEGQFAELKKEEPEFMKELNTSTKHRAPRQLILTHSNKISSNGND